MVSTQSVPSNQISQSEVSELQQ